MTEQRAVYLPVKSKALDVAKCRLRDNRPFDYLGQPHSVASISGDKSFFEGKLMQRVTLEKIVS